MSGLLVEICKDVQLSDNEKQIFFFLLFMFVVSLGCSLLRRILPIIEKKRDEKFWKDFEKAWEDLDHETVSK